MAGTPRARKRRSAELVPRTERGVSPILIEHRGPVAILTLNRPPINVLSRELLTEFAHRVAELVDDPTVRVLVITSAASGFSGGADIRHMLEMSRGEATAFSSQGQALANLLERAPIPVLVAVHGYCFGGGFELAQACDFIVASEDAVFCEPEIQIGVVPGWGGSRRLTRAVGVARARRWIMTGEKIPAQRAYEWGLVDRVVPRKRLFEETIAFANELAARPAVALAATKYLVTEASDPNRSLGLAYERDLWGLMFERHDQREGMHAFLEKRPPVFTDRLQDEPGLADLPWEVPQSPLELAKGQIERFRHAASPTPPSHTVPTPFDWRAMAEGYRQAGWRAFETFFAMVEEMNESYRFWAQRVLKAPLR